MTLVQRPRVHRHEVFVATRQGHERSDIPATARVALGVHPELFADERPTCSQQCCACVDPESRDATRYTVSVLTIVGRILLGLYKTRDKVHQKQSMRSCGCIRSTEHKQSRLLQMLSPTSTFQRRCSTMTQSWMSAAMAVLESSGGCIECLSGGASLTGRKHSRTSV